MQARHRYENLLRAMELAKLAGQPYVPYDADEMHEITGYEALKHLPPAPADDLSVDGWKVYLISGKNTAYAAYDKFVEHLGYSINDPSLVTVGVMAHNSRFIVYYKQ
jgi:hypothetical protein